MIYRGLCHASTLNSCTQILIFPCFIPIPLCFLCLYAPLPSSLAPRLSFKSEKTHIREESSRNAAFRNKNKHAVCPRWYRCFQTGWGIEETASGQGVGVCGAPLPGFYKPGGCWVLLSSGGQYSARCTRSGRESGDDRNEKETRTWQRTGAKGK